LKRTISRQRFLCNSTRYPSGDATANRSLDAILYRALIKSNLFNINELIQTHQRLAEIREGHLARFGFARFFIFILQVLS